jgi:hypothetical protein
VKFFKRKLPFHEAELHTQNSNALKLIILPRVSVLLASVGYVPHWMILRTSVFAKAALSMSTLSLEANI